MSINLFCKRGRGEIGERERERDREGEEREREKKEIF
jgi:hypothetical protein